MADVNLTTTVPELYVQKVIEMLELFSNKKITVEVNGQSVHEAKSFLFEGIRDGETQKDLAERFVRDFLLNGLKIVEKYKADQARLEAINGINIPEEEVPEDSIQ